jgi:NADP-dependent 3-hydroxy acid dehydrogenase YdfG
MKRLESKVAIITGVAQGLGEAIARGFASEGAITVLTDIKLNGLEKLQKELQQAGGEVLALELDVTNESQWKEVIKTF